MKNLGGDETRFGGENSEVLSRVATVKKVRIDRFRFGDDGGRQCLTVKADAGDKGASPSRPWDSNVEIPAGWDLTWTSKDFDILSVGEHLNTHFVHVEDESWVDAVELRGDVVVELLVISSFDIDTGRFTGGGKCEDEVLSQEVHPQRVGRHGDPQLVVDVVHQDANRDGFTSVIFGVYEDFDNFINVTQGARGSRSRRLFRVIVPVLLDPAGYPALADVQDNGDVLLLDAVWLHGVEKPDALGVADFRVEIALSDLVEQALHLLLSARRKFLQIVLYLGLGAAWQALVLLGLGWGWGRRGRHWRTINYRRLSRSGF